MAENKTTTTEKKIVVKPYSGVGRRKNAVARVWLFAEKGEFTVNDKPINDFFFHEEDKLVWVKPFHAVGISHPHAKMSGSIKVYGGGLTGQIEAISLGISRALASIDVTYEAILKKQDLLKRDPRMVEPKKYYRHKARKAPQYSKR